MSSPVASWYAGRHVFVTGHTGFKGSWLARWLVEAGARVTGYALPPDGQPNLFDASDVQAGSRSIIGDVRDAPALERALQESTPELIFHLAAQSLVRRSYQQPVDTYAVNVVGTAQVLDIARRMRDLRAVVVVTSDKCYENRALARGYRESDPMGGHDPYSSSKGCAELVTSAFRRSFFASGAAAVASVRAGNVIGGGDWAADRLVPDIVRGIAQGRRIAIRNPDAVRPWQFVLEPLRGYLMLGRSLAEQGHSFAEGWNFGPRDTDAVPVRDLANRIAERWPGAHFDLATERTGPHEAELLRLDCTNAHERLQWRPVLDLNDALDLTLSWYRAYYEDPGRAREMMRAQLKDYERRVAAAELTQ